MYDMTSNVWQNHLYEAEMIFDCGKIYTMYSQNNSDMMKFIDMYIILSFISW